MNREENFFSCIESQPINALRFLRQGVLLTKNQRYAVSPHKHSDLVTELLHK